MTGSSPMPLAELLTAAIRVLDQAGDLPPVTVICSPAERFLAHVTITPASHNMSHADQATVVQAVAAAMRWPVRPLLDVEDGFTSEGTVGEARVEAIAAPLTSAERFQVRTGDTTTAAYVNLLRELMDWGAALPQRINALEIREDFDAGTFTARLVLPDEAAAADLDGLIITDVQPVDWSGFRGAGVLPTGHALTVSIGSC